MQCLFVVAILTAHAKSCDPSTNILQSRSTEANACLSHWWPDRVVPTDYIYRHDMSHVTTPYIYGPVAPINVTCTVISNVLTDFTLRKQTEKTLQFPACNFGLPAYIDGSMQDCSNSTANALELLQYCTKPSIHSQNNCTMMGKQWITATCGYWYDKWTPIT